jgi:Aspartyl protease
VPQPVTIQALVDTGASGTCVDPAVLAGLQLSATGTTLVHTPTTKGQPESADLFDISLTIYGPTVFGPLTIPNLPAMSSDLAIQGIQALIGRDVLAQCFLMYNGTRGEFTLGF